jgi:hypothetical protein
VYIDCNSKRCPVAIEGIVRYQAEALIIYKEKIKIKGGLQKNPLQVSLIASREALQLQVEKHFNCKSTSTSVAPLQTLQLQKKSFACDCKQLEKNFSCKSTSTSVATPQTLLFAATKKLHMRLIASPQVL